jgi:hypothetical protein
MTFVPNSESENQFVGHLEEDQILTQIVFLSGKLFGGRYHDSTVRKKENKNVRSSRT